MFKKSLSRSPPDIVPTRSKTSPIVVDGGTTKTQAVTAIPTTATQRTHLSISLSFSFSHSSRHTHSLYIRGSPLWNCARRYAFVLVDQHHWHERVHSCSHVNDFSVSHSAYRWPTNAIYLFTILHLLFKVSSATEEVTSVAATQRKVFTHSNRFWYFQIGCNGLQYNKMQHWKHKYVCIYVRKITFMYVCIYIVAGWI